MKTLVVILLLSSLMIAPILAGGADSRAELNQTAVIENLARGINSANDGLRISSAEIIKQVIDNNLIRPADFSASLIPLLKMLDNGNTDYERMTAALALYSLGNGIGIYKLRGAARFDGSERVRSVSKNLYYGYHTIHHSTYFLDF